MAALRDLRTRRSNTFMTMEVRATGRWSFRLAMLGFLGTGTVVKVLKHRGTWHCSSDLLNRAVNTGASWSAHDLRVAGDTLSGPDAFLGFWLRKRLLTSLSCMTNGGPGGPGTASDPR